MEKIKKARYLIYAIIDYIIIGVVIYGLFDYTYDGYPEWVPYLIIIFFFIMSVLRLRQFSRDLRGAEELDEEVENAFSEQEEQLDESELRAIEPRKLEAMGDIKTDEGEGEQAAIDESAHKAEEPEKEPENEVKADEEEKPEPAE